MARSRDIGGFRALAFFSVRPLNVLSAPPSLSDGKALHF